MKYVWLASLTVCLFLFVTCTNNVTGNSKKNEKQTIPAMLYNPGGSPAVHAKVRFFPINYNPHTGSLSKKLASADSATTDSTGNYSVKLDTGTYNVLATGDSGVVYQDSIIVTKDSAIRPPADTLKVPGGLRGRVHLQPGDDARTVFILFMGTNTWGTPDDSTGKFTVTNMAQGMYRVRVLTTLDAYVPKDTALSVAAGKVDSLAHDIVLQYTGIPRPTGLIVSYDTLRQTVILAWTGADTSLITGYNVYRAVKGQNLALITQTPLPDTVKTFRDSTVTVGTTYQYTVVSLRAGQESPKLVIQGDTMKVLSSSLVTTTFAWNLNNTIGDTASINDTIKACLTYSNPTRKIVKVVWYADSLNSPAVRQKSDSSLTGKDTLAYWWKQAGNKKIFVKVTDGAGTVWTDTLNIVIIQDVPVITFLSADTVVNHSGTVRCSVYVQQEFGTMTIEIDTVNSGNFKSLGGLGLSGGKSYSFSTDNACTWDSVKVRITDDDANVVIKGFKVQLLYSPPVIQKVNPDTTIAIKDSVTFYVSATAPDGNMTQVAWDFDGNGVYDWTSATLQNCGYRYQTAGLYKAVLRLTDECQKLTYDTVRVTVLQDVPVLNAGADTTVSIKDTIKLHGSATHQFGTITEWAWDIGNTGTFKVTSKGDTNIIAPPAENLNYLCVLKVTDSHGNVAKDTVKITVLQDVPVPNAGVDTTVSIDANVPFKGTATQQFGTIVMYKWDFDGDGTYDDSSTTTGAATHTYTHEAVYNAKLLVRDDDGNEATAIRHVAVVNLPPVITSIRQDTTISIKDSIQLFGVAHDPDGTIKEYAWDFNGDGVFEYTSATQIIAGFRYNTAGMYKAVLRVTDDDNKVTKDTTTITVLQDVPIIKFLSGDTVIDHGGTVRCSVYVQQQFGIMIVEIDTANSGNYKALGNLGLSGGEASTFTTSNASLWDSVKVRITDSKGNVVIKGFRVRIKPRPLTVTSIDSTANTITVHYSQSQETDFKQYRIYRNTTNTVDTTSELWATITAIGTVSYTTPTPSYAWNPRYYRVYQEDNEGLWSAGSNVVYGCIVNSPPSTPVITYPVNNGDSIWPNDKLCWHPSIDPNGNGVSYKVYVNYNNAGYSQYATALPDTFVQLTGCDSVLSLKFKVIAYDMLGDSSAWSTEKSAFVKHAIIDIDGNTYSIVTIGTQLWTVENLKTTRYNDGTPIPLETDNTAWSSLTTPGYCWYNNDSASNANPYGALYNWYTVNTGKLVPMGWHVPSDSEWTVLTTYLGGGNVAGGPLKDTGTTYWGSPNGGATNASGFSALPGGCRWSGVFFDIIYMGFWWSSSTFDATNSDYRYMTWGGTSGSGTSVGGGSDSTSFGLSVRCLRNP